jgi:hypothetical protein
MRILIFDMNVQAEMKVIQDRLRTAGHTVADLLRRAEVNRSQWERWKTGQDPQLRTWTKVVEAADELAARPPSQGAAA